MLDCFQHEKETGYRYPDHRFYLGEHASLADFIAHAGMEVPRGVRSYTKMLTLSIPAKEALPEEITALTRQCASE